MSAGEQELFARELFTPLWSASAWQSRGLVDRLRNILSGEEPVSLELGADNAWRLSIEGIIFNSRRRAPGFFCPIAIASELKPETALSILIGPKVQLRPGAFDPFSCNGVGFFIPPDTTATPAPPKLFATGDLGWRDQALSDSEFCLVRPQGQFSAASSRIGAMIGPVRTCRVRAIVSASLLHQALCAGPYLEYAFTPERLWLYRKYLNSEIPAELNQPAFDPSPLIAKVQSYPVQIEVEAGNPSEWDLNAIHELSTIEISNHELVVRNNHNLLRLAAKVVRNISGPRKWRLKGRPLFYALSRGEM